MNFRKLLKSSLRGKKENSLTLWSETYLSYNEEIQSTAETYTKYQLLNLVNV